MLPVASCLYVAVFEGRFARGIGESLFFSFPALSTIPFLLGLSRGVSFGEEKRGGRVLLCRASPRCYLEKGLDNHCKFSRYGTRSSDDAVFAELCGNSCFAFVFFFFFFFFPLLS